MIKFTALERQMPSKREITSRCQDFLEIYDQSRSQIATEQASRCSQCGIPFCQIHCPLENNIPDWLQAVADGRLQDAYELSSATNNMPEICGRVCPQDRLCEGSCVIEKDFGAVTIGIVEKYITDTAWAEGWVKPFTVKRTYEESVAIIGAGPGGLAAAEMLCRKGYTVNVYDRYDRVGGLLIYGIPGFKLEKDIVVRRAELLEASGVRFHLNCNVGEDVSFDSLRQKHDAVLIATGVYKAREVDLPGANLKGVVSALDYLTVSNRYSLGDYVKSYKDGTMNAQGKNVVVIGGGDTAMDCVRTAIRQNAKSVKCLYRRDRANMPGSQREVHNAEEEGVEFVWLTAPDSFCGVDHVTGVRSVKMHLGAVDVTGRRVPQPIPDSYQIHSADMVIKALGFDAEDLSTLWQQPDLPLTRWGTLNINWNKMMSSLEGVFGVGDIVRGASLVVWAIKDGRDAARSIDAYIRQKKSVRP